MITYQGWANVPPNLKTKTTIKKEGLRLKRGQTHVAWVETRYGSKRNDYKLYDVSECIPAKPPTEKQLEAAKKGREASLAARTCKRCGYVERLSQDYRNKYQVNKSGYCDNCEKWLEIESDHTDAIEWAKAILADPMAIILDTETTGLDGEIIELAIINMQGETLFNKRFKPITEIEEGASAVHGITLDMLADEADFAQYADVLRLLLGNASTVVIYNEDFDVARLRTICKLHEIPKFKFESSCAMSLYAQWYGEWSNYWESYKWQPLGGGDHTALGDCLATLGVIQTMADKEITPDDVPVE